MSSAIEDAFALSQQRVLKATGWLCVVGAMIVLGGVALALSTGTHYWVDRSGKTLVVVSLMLTYLQFRLEYRYTDRLDERIVRVARIVERKGRLRAEARTIAERAGKGQLVTFERARRRVFMRAIVLAGLGELIAAFGSVVCGALVRAASLA